MSHETARGPKNPSRIIFVTTTLFGVAVGLVTGHIGWFTLAVIGCASVLSAGYGLIRRRLGWQPLNGDDLFNLIHVIGPH